MLLQIHVALAYFHLCGLFPAGCPLRRSVGPAALQPLPNPVLSSGLQALRPQQLAVFFRNNHFNVLFAHNGELMTLVTDQGYLHEEARHPALSTPKELSYCTANCHL